MEWKNMTQTEYKDSYAASGVAKLKFSVVLETQTTQQKAFKG